MRRGCRMYDQRFRIADVGKMRQHLHAFDEAHAGLRSAFYAERQDAGGPAWKILARERFVAIAG